MIKRTIILGALALAGCGDPPKPEVVLVESEARVAELPAECTSRDPKWTPMPDGDLDKKTIPRITKKNETTFAEVIGKRGVCRDAIVAQSRKAS